MSGIKHAVVDIVVTAVILLAVSTQWSWARWVVIIYTPVMLLLKVVAVTTSTRIVKLKSAGVEPPRALLHVLYAANVAALGMAGWWYLFAGWTIIWLLSVVQERRAR